MNVFRVDNWLSNGFQKKESMKQFTLWSEAVVKGLKARFSTLGHAARTSVPFMRLPSVKE